ncbi:uncharacterized protein I303_108079 [Kwoniella dejecticola CBS 10117]|uniref:Glycosyltransferase n=1 Tax=Kwoniella dejecticola CBS 10117 TaxID=1296121 RepID=A0A1A5ZWH7_9TREE|nr:uncharacterized protein I303_08070 [Kwoniella dejecticola CBS 10117]OBR82156.1 hypothetical protein I303_08070 [Kwoniella dejecticola CBS 10117]
MSRPRSRFLPTRRSLPFLLLSTLFVLYKSIPSELSQKAIPSSISSYLNSDSELDPIYPHPNLHLHGSGSGIGISTKSAGDHGTFVETSAYDLPKLIKSKNDRLRAKRLRSKRAVEPSLSTTPEGEITQQSDEEDPINHPDEVEDEVEGSAIEGLRIAVLEHAGFHEEVVGAVLKTLTDVGANFTLYRDNFRWGYAEVLESGMNYTTPPTPYSDGTFANAVSADEIDVVIHISCDHGFWNWPRNVPAYEAMKSNPNLEVVCMLHELENLNEDERKSWEIAANQERLTYLTLSKHVKKYLKNEVLKWSHSLKQLSWGKVDVEEFVPIFPVDAAVLPDSDSVQVSEFFPKRAERVPSRLAILGNIQPWRRNYNPILGDLHKSIQADPASWGYLPLSTDPNATYVSANDDSRLPVTLHFIGSLFPTAQLEIPESMKDMVFIHSDLEYIDFYRLLGSMDLILPAFVGWTYLEKKLSSAIPAGVVSRVPVLGSELLLNAYQFLRDPSIVLHAPGLREIEAVEMLRKGIDPYTNRPLARTHHQAVTGDNSSGNENENGNEIAKGNGKGKVSLMDAKPLLPKFNSNTHTEGRLHPRGLGKQLPLGMKKLNDDIPTKQIASSSQEDWAEYHENLYNANKEMMLDLFERLAERIERRKSFGKF